MSDVEDNKFQKAYFFKRFLAYLVDIILVSIVATLIALPFRTESVDKVDNQILEVTQKALQGKIKTETYTTQLNELAYQKAKLDGISNIIIILISVLNFIVYQGITKGQTIGKKLLKIKIVKINGNELTFNDLIFRNLLNNFIFFDILLAVFALIGRKPYIYGYRSINIVETILLIVSVFMIAIRKDGRSVMDLLTNTMVVKVEEK
ncbi:MAG: RDD family protein [Bacilli bacterium]|nr:RDD family protein [Bacilli bacterium]